MQVNEPVHGEVMAEQGISNTMLMARMVEMMDNQQRMLDKMLNKPQEMKVEGICMPQYHGRMLESVDLFFDQSVRFFEAKNIDWKDASNAKRVLAIMASNLRSGAAAWYITKKDYIATIEDLFNELKIEFVPGDLQERLRDMLIELKQRDCKDLSEYIFRHRQIMSQVIEMSELDKIMYFMRGLVSKTKEEVQYRRCSTLATAMSVALEYERSHRNNYQERSNFKPNYRNQNRSHSRGDDRGKHEVYNRFRQRESDDMEIGNTSELNREECMRRRLCFYCKMPGHIMNNCPKRRNSRRPAVSHYEELDQQQEEDLPIIFDRLTVGSGEFQHQRENELLRMDGVLDGRPVKIMLDSGASNNVIRPGIAKKIVKVAATKVERFDGTLTATKLIRRCKGDVTMGNYEFKDLEFTEWELPPSHDIIFGKPWFTKYQPQVNWRTHEVELPQVNSPLLVSGSNFRSKLRNGEYCEVFKVKVNAVKEDKPVPPIIQDLIEEFKDVFPEKLPDTLPPQRRVQFDLKMKSDATPSARAPFRLSKTEEEALDAFIQETLKKNWIELSDSPWVSNIFGVPKRNQQTGQLLKRSEWLRSGNSNIPIRWVIDYRYVNSQTLIPKIPLPLIEVLFDRMVQAEVFTVIDLAQGYHQMLVDKDSRKYTAFRTSRDTYQWCVAPMGLAGMPGIWSRLMHTIFGHLDFVVVYLDDICVFSKSNAAHLNHLREVFMILRKEKLYAHSSKCDFGQSSVKFLGHQVSKEGLSVDKGKTSAIEKWPTPSSQKDLLSFLGLAGYYRRFICDFAELALPLSELTKKDCAWNWGSLQEKAFVDLKVALQQAPVLRLPDFSKSFVVTTDASDISAGGVLSQIFGSEDHPIAFFSKKFGIHERNWPAHEKELFAIKMALEKWRHYLHGRHFEVFTDNSACKWLLHHPRVSPKLARYLDFFSQFEFTLHHVKGSLNVVADALSRVEVTSISSSFQVHACDNKCLARSQSSRRHRSFICHISHISLRDSYILLDTPEFLGEEMINISHPIGVRQELASIQGKEFVERCSINFVKVENSRAVFMISSVHLDEATKRVFQNGYLIDPCFKDVWSANGNEKFKKLNGLLWLKTKHTVNRLCVPDYRDLRLKVLIEFHDSPVAAHPGTRRTQFKIAQWYYWQQLENDVKNYVKSCQTCSRWKSNSLKKNGKLIPIPIPKACWEVISMDFVTGLPVSNGFDAIMTVVDKLSKRPKYAPTHTVDDAQEVAKIFFDTVVRHHGLPKTIISDRDPKFTSKFWRALMKLLGVQLSMTTSHRAQADGQTERQNLVLEDALRCMVSYHGQDWSNHLPTIEYAHATLVSSSSKLSPFQLDTGREINNVIAAEAEDLNSSPSSMSNVEFAQKFALERKRLVDMARENLQDAQVRMKKYYDRTRSNVVFKIGDLVMLDTKNLPLKHAGNQGKAKLSAKKVGPFEITAMINENVAKLRLPKSMSRLNATFNVDLLHHYVENPIQFRSRPIPKASPVILDEDTGEELHIVEKLLRKRLFKRKTEWLVKWHGFPEYEATWEPESNIKHISHWQDLLENFINHQREVNSGGMS